MDERFMSSAEGGSLIIVCDCLVCELRGGLDDLEEGEFAVVLVRGEGRLGRLSCWGKHGDTVLCRE